jgi:cobalt transporter subunit CbtA
VNTILNWGAFKSILATAAVSGLIAGLLLTAVQQVQIRPIIAQAEIYEQAASAEAAEHHQDAHEHSGEHAHEHEAHEHSASDWQPAEGTERTAFTALANVSLAIGFGLFLTAAFSLRVNNKKETNNSPVNSKAYDWRAGLLWGLAGYIVFFVTPSLGLPPELPGAQSAPLHDRQLWWLLTVLTSASGLYLLAFVKQLGYKALGLVLLASPYLIGAPEPLMHAATAVEALASTFIQATAIANAIFWLSLGMLVSYFYKIFK